jgi:diaminopimelate epimerase
MRFHKMHGAGNDYVYVDLWEETVADPIDLAVRLSDRHFGVGGDGVILIDRSETAGGRMRMYNADGSEGEMCGNGVRCVAKFLHDRGRINEQGTIETKAGIVGVDVVESDRSGVSWIRIDMGEPRLKPALIPTTLRAGGEDDPLISIPLAGETADYRVTCVSMGNPHCVIFTEGIDELPLERIGPPLEHHAAFPQRVNIEFVEVVSRSRLRQRTWERGSGETLACGSGACAVLVAAVLNNLADRSAAVELRGGDLRIEWGADGHVRMTGPAAYVFSGEVEPGRVLIPRR